MIDINVSYGPWPFQQFPHRNLEHLAAHQASHGVGCSLVSHLGAVWHPDPDPYNMAIIQAASSLDSVKPVAVINPLWPVWQAQCDHYIRRGVAGLKLYPAYHGYKLSDKAVGPFLTYVHQLQVPLFIQIRIEDERMQHPASQITSVPVKDVVFMDAEYPDMVLVCLNAYLPEVRAIANQTTHVGFDTSFCEWLFTMEHLLDVLPPERIYLGTHTPFLYTKACIAKVMKSRVRDAVKHQVVHLNAGQLMGKGSNN